MTCSRWRSHTPTTQPLLHEVFVIQPDWPAYSCGGTQQGVLIGQLWVPPLVQAGLVGTAPPPPSAEENTPCGASWIRLPLNPRGVTSHPRERGRGAAGGAWAGCGAVPAGCPPCKYAPCHACPLQLWLSGAVSRIPDWLWTAHISSSDSAPLLQNIKSQINMCLCLQMFIVMLSCIKHCRVFSWL